MKNILFHVSKLSWAGVEGTSEVTEVRDPKAQMEAFSFPLLPSLPTCLLCSFLLQNGFVLVMENMAADCVLTSS